MMSEHCPVKGFDTKTLRREMRGRRYRRLVADIKYVAAAIGFDGHTRDIPRLAEALDRLQIRPLNITGDQTWHRGSGTAPKLETFIRRNLPESLHHRR